MANTAHLVRRQSSRDLNPQRSLDRLEMKEMRGRLVVENGSSSSYSYGATNAAFDDSSPNTKIGKVTSASKLAGSAEGKAMFKPEGGEEERESWDSKLTFLLATIGYAVGLGNVWRFPYLAQKNGGGAFLIPYFIMLCIEGIPIFYLELAIGQRLRKGAIGVWNQVSPRLGGIGIASAVVSFNVALYYNTIIAWCLFYFVQSFQAQLPWAECPQKFFPNGSYILEPECVTSTPTQYFWYRTTLMVSEDINSPTVFNWKIAIALVIAWILVYMCMIKGGVRDRDLPLPRPHHLLLPRHHAQRLHGRAAAPIHAEVAHAVGPGGVAGGGHADLLLAGAGLWRPHRLLLLQPRQQQLLTGRHHGVAHQLPHVHVRRHRRLLRHRLQGHHELREVPGPAQRHPSGVEHGHHHGGQRLPQLYHRHDQRAARAPRVRPAEGARQLSRGHGAGLHHLHRGHQPVPRGAVLVRALLPDALHARHRLAVRHAGGGGHVHRRHEAVPQPAEGGADGRAVPHLLHHLHGVRARRGQLRVRALRQLQRQLPAAHHRLLRVHRRVLRVRLEAVRRRHRADDGVPAAPVLAHLLEVPVAAGHAVHPGRVLRADRGGRLGLRGLGGRQGRDGEARVARVGAGPHRRPHPGLRAVDPGRLHSQDVRLAHHRGQREGLVPRCGPARVPWHHAARGDDGRDAAVLHPRGRQRGAVLSHGGAASSDEDDDDA